MRVAMFILFGLLLAALLTPQASRAAEQDKEYLPNYIPSTASGAPRDSIWKLGHEYRQWIYDQNFIQDDNENLDPEISFLDDCRVRSHPQRVYFYNDITTAIEKARQCGKGVVVYVFDHGCRSCLFLLPQLYTHPEVVEASKDFVNLYVELPKMQIEATQHGIMTSSLSVQFFMPSGRILRTLDGPVLAKLMEGYDQIGAYIDKNIEEDLATIHKPAEEPELEPVRAGGY